MDPNEHPQGPRSSTESPSDSPDLERRLSRTANIAEAINLFFFVGSIFISDQKSNLLLAFILLTLWIYGFPKLLKWLLKNKAIIITILSQITYLLAILVVFVLEFNYLILPYMETEITGKAVLGGDPVPDIPVILHTFSDRVYETRTNQRGEFKVDSVRKGEVIIKIYGEEVASATVSWRDVLPWSDAVDIGEIVVVPCHSGPLCNIFPQIEYGTPSPKAREFRGALLEQSYTEECANTSSKGLQLEYDASMPKSYGIWDIVWEQPMLDISPYHVLELDIKGRNGNESVTIKLVDSTGSMMELSIEAETGWQHKELLLEDFASSVGVSEKPSALHKMEFSFNKNNEPGVICIDNMELR